MSTELLTVNQQGIETDETGLVGDIFPPSPSYPYLSERSSALPRSGSWSWHMRTGGLGASGDWVVLGFDGGGATEDVTAGIYGPVTLSGCPSIPSPSNWETLAFSAWLRKGPQNGTKADLGLYLFDDAGNLRLSADTYPEWYSVPQSYWEQWSCSVSASDMDPAWDPLTHAVLLVREYYVGASNPWLNDMYVDDISLTTSVDLVMGDWGGAGKGRFLHPRKDMTRDRDLHLRNQIAVEEALVPVTQTRARTSISD